MASKAPKVRIVRCPKCLRLLPEVASVSVYQCGKCGTTLRAKNRTEDQESESPDNLRQNFTQKTELEHDSEDKESTSSSQKALSCSTDGSEQAEPQDFAKVKSSSERTSNGSTSSDALNWRENGSSSSVAGGSGEDGKHGRGSELENPSSARQGISGGSNLMSAAQNSLKFNASSVSEEKIVRRYADLIRSKSPVRIAKATNSSITSEDDRVSNKLEGGLEASKPSTTKTLHAYEGNVSSSNDCGDQVSDLRSPQSKEYFSGPQRVAELVSANTGNLMEDVAVDKKINTESEGQNEEKKFSSMSLDGKYSPVTDDSVSSEDDMVTDTYRGELGSSEPLVSNGNVSSSDGWGDQDLHSRRSKESSLGSQSVEELVTTAEGAIEREVSVNNRIDTESEVQNQEIVSSLMLAHEKYGPVTDESIISEDDMITDKHRDELEVSKLSANERHGPTIFGDVSAPKDEIAASTRYPFHDQMNVNISSFKSAQTSFKSTLSWLEEEREGLESMQRFGQRDYENRSLPPPQKLETVERNQLELLRKVEELSDQLNRSYAQSKNTNDRFPRKGNLQRRQHPFYYTNQSLPDHDTSHQYVTDFPGNPHGTYKPNNSMPFRYGYHHSGNVSNYRNQANCSCSSVYSEDLLQANVHYSGGQCRVYPDHVCYSIYTSGPSSPEQHLHTRYSLRSHELGTVPRDHTDRAHNVESLPRRERRQSVKRHCRPIAGGAPFLTCYTCNTLLYLPADSFLSSKRCHKLQCGSCSKVLMFSLERGTHVARYYQEKVMLAPSVINSSRGSNSTRNSVFKPHSSENHGDPSAYSEDAGLSIRDGGSTDGESGDSTYGKKMRNDKKKGIRENTYGKRLVLDSRSPSYNEAESAREGGVAALHELMGYSTVSRILKSTGAL